MLRPIYVGKCSQFGVFSGCVQYRVLHALHYGPIMPRTACLFMVQNSTALVLFCWRRSKMWFGQLSASCNMWKRVHLSSLCSKLRRVDLPCYYSWLNPGAMPTKPQRSIPHLYLLMTSNGDVAARQMPASCSSLSRAGICPYCCPMWLYSSLACCALTETVVCCGCFHLSFGQPWHRHGPSWFVVIDSVSPYLSHLLSLEEARLGLRSLSVC